MADKNRLQAKEGNLFKTALRYYELKQYKKGLKTTDQILKKAPEHGETLALKGLFLCNLGRKDEGYVEVKKGIKNNITSYISWHIFGLVYRLDKNYEEAIKCYQNALRIDKDNIQIVRDLSILQTQMRNYEGLNETEYQLVNLKPNNKPFWIGLAFSFFLLKKYDSAIKVLDAFESSLKEKPKESAYEVSEMLLFKNLIIEESGEYEKALEHLNSVEQNVVDKRGLMETKGRLLMNLNRFEEAEKVYRELFDKNSNCDDYLQKLFKCHGIDTSDSSSENIRKLIEFNKEFIEKYPKSLILKRIPLIYLSGEEFKNEMRSYLKSYFIKGVPSLFVNLKDLFANEEKAKIIEEIVLEFYKSLTETKKFSDDENVQIPTTYLWILIFLAQLYDFKRETPKALEYINKAIEHTPTLVESYMIKARIYKHGGDIETAKNVMNEAREMDLQDRFVNSKCTKYMLRNGDIEEAEKTAGLFTKADSAGPLADLTDMQCIWFEYENAMAYIKKGNYGRALKMLHQINTHFKDIYDDQFDFHIYCLRKSSFRAYINLLRFEDKLKSHPFYFKAAVTAIKLYLKLNSEPRKTKEEKENEQFANLSPSERKKAMRKARKAQLKKNEQNEQNQKKDDNSKKNVDNDPDGEKLLEAKDYLEEAIRFLKPLLEYAPNRIETHILACQVYLNKKKYLLAFKSLKKSYAIDKNNEEVHKNIVSFVQNFNKEKENVNATSRKIIEEELSQMIPENNIQKFNDEFVNNNLTSVSHILKAAECQYLIDKSKGIAYLESMVDSIDDKKYEKSRTLKTCIELHQALLNVFNNTEKADLLKSKLSQIFTVSTYFKN